MPCDKAHVQSPETTPYQQKGLLVQSILLRARLEVYASKMEHDPLPSAWQQYVRNTHPLPLCEVQTFYVASFERKESQTLLASIELAIEVSLFGHARNLSSATP